MEIHLVLSKAQRSHKDVDTVMFSCLYYDHIGDPSKFKSQTRFYFGLGAGTFIRGANSYLEKMRNLILTLGAIPLHRLIELPDAVDNKY
jgi:hypothetical protein